MTEKLREVLHAIDEQTEKDIRDPDHIWECSQCGAKIKGYEWFMHHWEKHFEPTYEQLNRRMTI